MKRAHLTIILAVVIISAFALMANAAPQTSTWTETQTRMADGYRITTLAFTADSTGTVASYETTAYFRGVIKQVVTNPDTSLAPADSTGRTPSDNYDITLTNVDGVDVMGGALANRDSVNTEMAFPKSPANADWLFINDSKLTVAVTGNTKPNARGTIKIYWIEK